jgi:hypothetical protein
MCTGAFLAENSHHSNTYIVDSNSQILCAGNFRPPVAVRGHALTCSRAQEAAGQRRVRGLHTWGPKGRSGRDHGFMRRREAAKPRSSDERRTIFRQSPRAAPVGPFAGNGHPGRQPSSAGRVRLPSKRSGAWEAGRAWEPGECNCFQWQY